MSQSPSPTTKENPPGLKFSILFKILISWSVLIVYQLFWMSLVQNKGILFACFIPYSYGQEKIMPEEEGGKGNKTGLWNWATTAI